MTQVSVIIPTHNRHQLLARCLESLRRQRFRDLEAIVVDNGSAPPVSMALLESLPGRVIRLERNTGFCYAVNRGVAAAGGSFLLLLNNDVELDPGFLDELLRAFGEEPTAGFATGKLLRAPNPKVIDGAGDALLIGGGAHRIGHGETDGGQFDSKAWTLSACGAATLYRRILWDKVGWLDEAFYAYLEDMDLALRAQRAGYRGLYVPQAVAYHHGSATLGPDDPRILSWITRNQFFLVWKNYPLSFFFRGAWRIAVFQTLWAMHLVRRGFVASYFRGCWQALAALPRVLAQRRAERASKRIRARDFWNLLRESERAIYDSEQRRQPQERSRLLTWYFALCGRPTTGQRSAVTRPEPTPAHPAMPQADKDVVK